MRRDYNVTAIIIWVLAAGSALAVLALIGCALLSPPPAPGSETLRYFETGFLERAAAYQRCSLALSLARRGVLFLVLALAALKAWRYFQGKPPLPLLTAVGYLFLLLLLLQLATFPLDFYRGYVVEHRFGLSAYTVGSWLADYGKGLLLNLFFGTAGLAVLYLLMLRWPRGWWAAAGLLFFLFLVLSSYLSPLLIDPLFNRFTPLQDEPLREEISALAEKAGISLSEILVMDAGRNTRKLNAYFTGLGRTRRIVLYDTLLENFDREEVLAVVAHELAHWRYNHVAKGIAFGAAGALLGLYLFQLLLQKTGTQPGIGAVYLAVLFLGLISTGTLPLSSSLSRHFEVEADRQALAWTGEEEAFISVQRQLAQANLAVVQPHPVIKTVLYSHPPTMERIALARSRSDAGKQPSSGQGGEIDP